VSLAALRLVTDAGEPPRDSPGPAALDGGAAGLEEIATTRLRPAVLWR